MSSSTAAPTRTLLPLALLPLLLTGCTSLKPVTPLNQLNQQQAQGYAVFQTHCAQCHYERVSQPKQGPSLRGIFQRTYLPSGAPANDERVADTILHGHGLMPPQPYTDPDSLAALLAYLHTL